MPSLFISYRRTDSPDTVKLIHERLKKRLPRWEIFYDHESIPLGEQFPERLRAKVTSATVVLVIIGPRWLEILRERRNAAVDHVREEVRLALEASTNVVPVLVGRASVPMEADLAEFADLQPLLLRNGRPVRPDPDFDADLESIIAHIKQFDSDEAIGATLADKYTLTAEIGHGGMGVVYRAEQKQPVKRTVAVKLIKPGMDSREVLARFDAERQALAVMDHPNIARVLDAGMTANGRPFFVMEFVKGVPITQYCDEKKLTPQERINLFVPVCNAVQHAHQKGIIHRDLKPSNVLVEVIDGRPVAKVIDFGLAKALGHKLTDKTLYTALDMRVGTLEYSAPEQAAGRSFDVDTRSDIYSLGVLLYELLTGAPPFTHEELLKIGEKEMCRVIIEDEPAKPSKKLSSSGELPAIAANRQLEPKKLTRLVRGDLDWIVMKCLEKEQARRYETANQLGQELQRFLADEPVQAGPPSVVYRLRKFVQRHKSGLLMTAASLLTVVAVVAVAFFQISAALDNEKEANNRSEQRRKDVEAALAEKEKANNELRAKEDELAGETARSWLLPWANQLGSSLIDPAPMSDQEIEVSYVIAINRDKGLTIRFIEEAVKEPWFIRRLGTRSEYALHAAVGLDIKKRERVEKLLFTRLQASGITAELRRELAVSLCAVGDLSPATATVVLPLLIQAMIGSNPTHLEYLETKLFPVGIRMEPKEAATILTRAMAKKTNSNTLVGLANGLAALAANMEPKGAAHMSGEAAAILTQAMSKMTNPIHRADLAKALTVLAARMEPGEAARVSAEAAAILTQAMSSTTEGYSLGALAKSLAAVAERMEPEKAARVSAEAAAILRGAMSPTLDESSAAAQMQVAEMANGLAAVAERMEPEKAARVSAEAATIITQKIFKSTEGHSLARLANSLAAVAARMEPKEAARVSAKTTAKLTQAIFKTRSFFLKELADSLAAVAAHMEPKEAARVSGTAADIVIQGMSKETDPFWLWYQACSLSALGARMEPKEAAHVSAEAAAMLTQAISKTTDKERLRWLAIGLVEVAARMEPKEAGSMSAQATATFIQAMSKKTRGYSIPEEAKGLAALAAHMEPKEATAILIQAMSKANIPSTRQELAKGLAAVVGGTHWNNRIAAHATLVGCFGDGHGLLGMLPALKLAIEPRVLPLDNQELVDLLKDPLCVGFARRAVLDELGRRYQHPFTDQWDFARFADEHKLGFDLAGPPTTRQRTEMDFP